MIKRRAFLAGAVSVGAMAVAGGSALAQGTFPTRNIRVVVPFPAGGTTDLLARVFAQRMSEGLGQTVLVENMGGAGGSVGADAVAKAEPDGHTLLFHNLTFSTTTTSLQHAGRARHDIDKDFAPISLAANVPMLLVAHPSVPAKDLKEFIDLAKKDEKPLFYGSTGPGSIMNFAGEVLKRDAGIKMEHVPFRGAAPLVQELVAGRIDVSNSTLPSVLGQIQGGQIRAIGLASPQRNAQIADVPTLREQGVTNADAESWAAFFAPAATPKPVLDRLSGTIVAILNKPEMKERITKLGFTLKVRDPEAFKPYLAQEIQTWSDIIKTAGIKPEAAN